MLSHFDKTLMAILSVLSEHGRLPSLRRRALVSVGQNRTLVAYEPAHRPHKALDATKAGARNILLPLFYTVKPFLV